MIRNFLFHRVNPQRDILWDPMDVSLFDKCMQYISANYNVVQLEQIFSEDFHFNPKKTYATVVFDDGYKDNIEHALPILQKYDIKASFYIVTDCIEKNIPTWTYNVDFAFENTSTDSIKLCFDFLPPEFQEKNLFTKQERIAFARKLKPVLKKLSHDDRLKVLMAIENSLDDVKLPKIMMDWDDIRYLRSKGHYIGSHTVTHSMLGTIENEDEVKMELQESGELIKNHLGYFPSTISYPVGSYNHATMRLSQEAGYKIGLAVKQRPYQPGIDDCFEVPRIELYNEPWLKTKLRIQNVVGAISRLLNRV